MFKNKGLYEWKLIEDDKVVAEGSQWNTSTDQMPLVLGCWEGSDPFLGNYNKRSIQLSGDSAPAGDLRQRYAPYQRINTLTNGRMWELAQTLDPVANTSSVQNLFSPPVAPRTIKIIGSSFNVSEAHPYEYASFIELSTPITQQTNQYLFVKYTLFYSFVAGGYNSPDNRYIQRRLSQLLVYRACETFGFPDGYGIQGLCAFNPPTDKDNVMRYIWRLSNNLATPQWFGPCYGQKWVQNYATTEVAYPLGVFVFGWPTQGSPVHDKAATIGYSIPSDFGPAISRVFTHPASRIDQIFSDPAYPPNSQGTIALTGTPTNKHAIVGRVRITKTGDASDIVDETFLPAVVNTGTNEITIAQSFAMDDIVRFTNVGGALPTGISAGVDHYVIQAGTTIQLSTSLGGLSITISDQGTGTHTILRQNTGRFSLELAPWRFSYKSSNQYPIPQLSMGVDIDNKMQPHVLADNIDLAEDEVSPRGDNMIEDQIQVGDFIYSIQKSRSTQLQNVCRWRFWTIETSVSLCKFGTTGTKAHRMVKVGTDVYIATSDGIYLYDTTTPTVASTLLTITGILSNPVLDLAYDPISTYMWSGHITGLSKIDLGASTATQYITGGGEKLEGMTAGMVHIVTGSLEAYNGRVLKDGAYYTGATHDQWFTDADKAWVLQDEANDGNSIGWCSLPTKYVSRGGCIRKGTNQIVDLQRSTLIVRTVIVTGLNSGTTVEVESLSLSMLIFYMAGISQVSDSIFLYVLQNDSGNYYTGTYVLGATNAQPVAGSPNNWNPEIYYLGGPYQSTTNSLAHMFRNLVDLDNGILIPILFCNATVYPVASIVTTFGWNGANWIKDNATDRPIPKTGTTALLQGVSVAFNNATGKPWDQQFVVGDRFTWVHGPNKIKDNLQTMRVAAKNYHVPVDVADAIVFTVPASVPYVCHVTETTDPDFRATDPDAMVVKVMEGATAYTEYAPTITSTWSVSDRPNDTISCGLNIATGTPVKLYRNSTIYSQFMFPTPLVDGGIYYAINVDTTHIKLAATYADAMAGTPVIDLLNAGYPAFSDAWRIGVLTPGTGKYSFGSNGVFIFAAADATKNLTLTYTYSLFA